MKKVDSFRRGLAHTIPRRKESVMGKRNRQRIERIKARLEQSISQRMRGGVMGKGEVLQLRKVLYKPTAKEIARLGGGR